MAKQDRSATTNGLRHLYVPTVNPKRGSVTSSILRKGLQLFKNAVMHSLTRIVHYVDRLKRIEHLAERAGPAFVMPTVKAA